MLLAENLNHSWNTGSGLGHCDTRRMLSSWKRGREKGLRGASVSCFYLIFCIILETTSE